MALSWFNLAVSEEQRGKFEKAKPYFEKARKVLKKSKHKHIKLRKVITRHLGKIQKELQLKKTAFQIKEFDKNSLLKKSSNRKGGRKKAKTNSVQYELQFSPNANSKPQRFEFKDFLRRNDIPFRPKSVKKTPQPPQPVQERTTVRKVRRKIRNRHKLFKSLDEKSYQPQPMPKIFLSKQRQIEIKAID